MPPRYTPGRILAEALAEKGMTQEKLAKEIGIERRHVHNICKDRAGITPDMAIKFAEAGVNPPAEFAEKFPMADSAEKWAAISAAHRVYRLRRGLPEFEPRPYPTTRRNSAKRTPVKGKA